MKGEGARRGQMIAEAVVAEVARTGRRGLVLASPPGPEADLLSSWLPETLPLRRPDPGAVSDVAGALAAAGAPGTHVEALAWQAVAGAQALSQGLLPVGTTNKTTLLLDDAPLPARVLPLGDVWATEVKRWAGRATLPAVLGSASDAEVAAVEEALRRVLLEGAATEAALASLGPLAPAVQAALEAAQHRRRALVVPTLAEGTGESTWLDDMEIG